jgi:hypothetical protein
MPPACGSAVYSASSQLDKSAQERTIDGTGGAGYDREVNRPGRGEVLELLGRIERSAAGYAEMHQAVARGLEILQRLVLPEAAS